MKTVTVLSDTHGNRRALDKLDTVLRESDYILHLGDTSADGVYLRHMYGAKTVVINGNCDAAKLGEDEAVIQIEGVKIFATHGHLYSAKTTLARLAERAKALDCALALYGHTHCAREDELDGVTLINGGCMTRFAANSYCYLVINGGKFTHKIVKTQ